MGYRGKLAEQAQARELRAQGYKLYEIANKLGVAKSSVSLWVRDVDFVPKDPRYGRWRLDRPPTIAMRRKQEEIERLLSEGRERLADLTEREFLVAGLALYAGEGAKRDGSVRLTNTNPSLIRYFMAWLRHFFDVDESRLRAQLYLHQGLDLDAANKFWSELTLIPIEQFCKPYRAVPDPAIRTAKHPNGCLTVRYGCSRTHRAIIGLIAALLSCETLSGVAQLAERSAVNRIVVGSSPTPGANPDPEPSGSWSGMLGP